MQKLLLAIFILIAVLLVYIKSQRQTIDLPGISLPVTVSKEEVMASKLKLKTASLKSYTKQNNLSDKYCFLIDMSLHSGQKRFFIYNLQKDSIINSGLVAHGSCNTKFLESPKFSNTVNSGCSSVGKYKIGYSYNGQFGRAYKLFGLENSNSNAFARAVVLHAYRCIPDEETFPQPVCNSLGCPMVSRQFLQTLSQTIKEANKPILLWIFN